MKKEPSFGALLREPAVQTYLLGCLMFLGLLALAEMASGQPVKVLLAPVILIVGVLGMFAHFGTAPQMVLLCVALGEMQARNPNWGGYYMTRPIWFDLPLTALLCLAVLGYLVCQFRLHALTTHLFPRDPRRRREPSPQKPIPFPRRRRLVQKRDPATFSVTEAILGLMAPPTWTLAAVALWWRIAAPPDLLGLPPWAGRALLLVWVVFALAALAGAALTYWRWNSWSREEALLVLQDTWWRETRRELARQYRWLAWARRRAEVRDAQQRISALGAGSASTPH